MLSAYIYALEYYTTPYLESEPSFLLDSARSRGAIMPHVGYPVRLSTPPTTGTVHLLGTVRRVCSFSFLHTQCLRQEPQIRNNYRSTLLYTLQSIKRTEFLPRLRDIPVRDHHRLLDEALDATQTRRNERNLEGIDEVARRLAVAVHEEGHHPSEAGHDPLGDLVVCKK